MYPNVGVMRKNKSERPRSRRTDLKRAKKKISTTKPSKKLVKKRSAVKPHVKKEILVQRSSGREEKFDTNRLAQTVSRSGVPYLMARDIAKTTTKKIKSQVATKPITEKGHKSSQRKPRTAKSKTVIVTASQVRNMVASELKERNRPDIASSYTGNPPANIDLQTKPNLDDREPVLDKVAANRTKVLFDRSKHKGSS